MNRTIENQLDLRRTSRFSGSFRKDAKSSFSFGGISIDTSTREKKIFRFYGGSEDAGILRRASHKVTIPQTQLVDLHKTDKNTGVVAFSF